MFLLFGLSNFAFIDSFRTSYEDSFVDPFSYITLFSVVISFILLFFSHQVFKLWLRRIIIWFLPISVFLIWFGSGGNDVVAPSETEVAILLGYTLTTITLIFALIQKFYYKK
jgi:hypothetical protein